MVLRAGDPRSRFLSPLMNRPLSRMSTKDRGYGPEHRRVRRSLLPIVAGGKSTCTRCGRAIKPHERWDLDHTDDRRGYRGPSHARCNRATKKRRPNSRDW